MMGNDDPLGIGEFDLSVDQSDEQISEMEEMQEM
jgi:hypothetical protein